MPEIVLEPSLLEVMAQRALKELGPGLSSLELSMQDRFQRGERTSKAFFDVRRSVGMYGGVYLAMLASKDFGRAGNNGFARAYASFVAASATSQVMNESVSSRIPPILSLPVDVTDFAVLNAVTIHFSKYVLATDRLEIIVKDNAAYFAWLADIASRALDQYPNLREQYKEKCIRGAKFSILGIPERKKPVQAVGQQDLRKGLDPYTLNPVRKDSIIGSKDILDRLETEVNCLMYYDPKRKDNPFSPFQQFVLLTGPTGAGKTLFANYAMTVASEIAAISRKPLRLVLLNFEDRYQCGPLDNIRSQLQEISSGDAIHIAFVDEMETKIGSRNNGASEGYRNEVLGQFLRFRGGSDYPNYHNYMIIGTSNKPDHIDPAALRVFDIYEVSGPQTTDERMAVLKVNLSLGMTRGTIRIQDWKGIRELLDIYPLNAADLVAVAQQAENKYRVIARSLSRHDLGYEESQHVVNRFLQQPQASAFITTERDVIDALHARADHYIKINRSFIGGAA